MSQPSEFIIVKHDAIKRGLHNDLRFKKPSGNMWISFSVRDQIPLVPGKKIVIIETTEHTREEALFIGKIESGYGAGTIEKYDKGACEIISCSNKHIKIIFHGSKIKGLYHIINTSTFGKGDKNSKTWLFFKASTQENNNE